MNRTKRAHAIAVLLIAALLIGATTLVLSAQVSIPQGSTINSAVFSIYAPDAPTYQTVRVHRVTADWGEYSVTWATFAKTLRSGRHRIVRGQQHGLGDH